MSPRVPSGLNQPAATAKPVQQAGPLTLTTEDGAILAGRLYEGEGSTGVVLAHMLGADQTGWQAFAQDLSEAGYHALTFDFRGHGQSEGDPNPATAPTDLLAAVRFLSDRPGVTRVFIVGASIGGTAALVAAPQLQADPAGTVAGIVTLSAPAEVGGVDAGMILAQVTIPRLFIGSAEDQRDTDPDQLGAASPGAQTAVFPGSAHGMEMLSSDAGAQVVARMLEFIEANDQGTEP